MRYFVTVDLTEELRPKIIELQEHIKDFDVKLVEPQNLHFTLKFLGNVDNTAIENAKGIIKQISSGFKPFDVHIKGMGAFPNDNHIRVVWVGCDALHPLQNAVEDAFAPMFKKEKTLPHLTIARVRSEKYMNAIKEFVSKHKDADIGLMHADKIKLKKSVVTIHGSIYEDIAVFDL